MTNTTTSNKLLNNITLAKFQTQWLHEVKYTSDATFTVLASAMDKIYNEAVTLPVNLFGTYLDNPNTTSIGTMTLTGALKTDVEAFTTAYDRAYASNSSAFSYGPQINLIYQLLVTREYLSTSAIGPANLSSAVQNMFTWLGDQHNVLFPTVPPTNGTDVVAYCASVDSALGNELGKFKNLINDANAIHDKAVILQNTVVDATTGIKVSSDTINWLMNAAPQGMGVNGGISYNGVSGLTYAQALLKAESDLFYEADAFVNTASKGIQQVIANKSFADEKALIAQIFDIVGGFTSGLAGLGKTYTAISALGKDASALNLIKVESEIGSNISTASSIVKNETSDWLSASKSNAGQFQYNKIGKITSDVTSLLGDSAPSELTAFSNTFVKDLTKLVVAIDTNLKQGVDTLMDDTFWDQSNRTGWKASNLPTLSISVNNFYGVAETHNVDTKAIFSNGTKGHDSAGNLTRTVDLSVAGYLTASVTVDYHTPRNMGYLPEIIVHGYNVI